MSDAGSVGPANSARSDPSCAPAGSPNGPLRKHKASRGCRGRKKRSSSDVGSGLSEVGLGLSEVGSGLSDVGLGLSDVGLGLKAVPQLIYTDEDPSETSIELSVMNSQNASESDFYADKGSRARPVLSGRYQYEYGVDESSLSDEELEVVELFSSHDEDGASTGAPPSPSLADKPGISGERISSGEKISSGERNLVAAFGIDASGVLGRRERLPSTLEGFATECGRTSASSIPSSLSPLELSKLVRFQIDSHSLSNGASSQQYAGSSMCNFYSVLSREEIEKIDVPSILTEGLKTAEERWKELRGTVSTSVNRLRAELDASRFDQHKYVLSSYVDAIRDKVSHACNDVLSDPRVSKIVSRIQNGKSVKIVHRRGGIQIGSRRSVVNLEGMCEGVSTDSGIDDTRAHAGSLPSIAE